MAETTRPLSAVEGPPPVNVLPRPVLVLIGALVAAALIGTAAVKLSGTDIREPDATALVTRALRFEDGATGGVVVIDAVTGQQVAHLSGEQGFLRGALRALARERRQIGAGGQQAFDLVLRSDGRLTLIDTVTLKRIDLESFGPTNAGVFARLLNRDDARQP